MRSVAARKIPDSEHAPLQALERGLPHYGKQGWLVFDGARVVDKGVGEVVVEQRAVQPARSGN